MNFHDLQKAFLAFRRSRGNAEAAKLIVAHGGDANNPTLDSVPQGTGQRSALLAAFKVGLPQHMKTLARAVAEEKAARARLSADGDVDAADKALKKARKAEGFKPFKRKDLEPKMDPIPVAPISVENDDDDDAPTARAQPDLDPAKIYARWNSIKGPEAE